MKNSFGEYKILLTIAVLVMATMTISSVSAQVDYGKNNTSYNYQAESEKQIQQQIKTLLLEKQIEANSSKWMSASQQNNRDFIVNFVANNPYQTITQTTGLAAVKKTIALQESGYMLTGSLTNYDHQVQDQTRAI